MRTPVVALLAATTLLTGGCVGAPISEEAEQASSELRSCNARWQPSADAMAAGNRANVPYQSAGGACSGGATAGALELGRYVRSHFGGQVDGSIPGDGIQIYNCRRVRGGSSMSLHSTGRAVDIFIPLRGGRADNAKGDVIANWLMANAEHIGIQYIIWDRTRFKASGSNRSRCYTGSHSHNNHIHVELSRAASSKRTPFFRGVPAVEPERPAEPAPDRQPDPQPRPERQPDVQPEPERRPERQPEPERQPDAQPEPDRPPDPAPRPVLGWIGDACSADGQCETGSCLLDHRPASGQGICVQACAGYCADRPGYATTFCAPNESVGARGAGGVCLSKAHALNGRCTHRGDLTPMEVARHVGGSGARHGYATICAPNEALPAAAPEAAPDRGAAPQQMCGGVGQAVSNNGDDCAGTPENTWRCACSGQWDVPISQVCRDGSWLTFHVDPRDCGACSGSYSRACD